MNKFFTKIAALSVGLAMAIGVGVAVGSKARDVARVNAEDATFTKNAVVREYGSSSTTQNANKQGTSKNPGGSVTITVPYTAANLTFYAGSWSGSSAANSVLSITVTGASGSVASFTMPANTGISSNSPFTLASGTNLNDHKCVLSFSNNPASGNISVLLENSNVRFVVWDATYSTSSGSSYISQLTVTHSSSASSIDVNDGATIDTSAFTISGTKSPSGSISSSDYQFLGSGVLDNSTFTPTSTTNYTYGDNRLCWESKLDTSSTDSTKQRAYFTINVAPPAPAYSISSTLSVAVDASSVLTATINAGVDVNKIVWSKEAGADGDANNISITPDGASVTVTGLAVGKATIVLTYNNDTANAKRCVVTVSETIEQTDRITLADIGSTGTSYNVVEISKKNGNSNIVSSAEYTIEGKENTDSFLVRKSNNGNTVFGGFIVTKSAGTVKSISVGTKASNNTAKTITFFGKNSAYTEIADLQDSTYKGTQDGTITAAVQNDFEDIVYTFDGGYEYVGFTVSSNSAAFSYLDITWLVDSSDLKPEISVGTTKAYVSTHQSTGEYPLVTTFNNVVQSNVSYTVTSNDTNVIGASISNGDTLVLTPGTTTGETTVDITVTDSKNRQGTLELPVELVSQYAYTQTTSLSDIVVGSEYTFFGGIKGNGGVWTYYASSSTISSDYITRVEVTGTNRAVVGATDVESYTLVPASTSGKYALWSSVQEKYLSASGTTLSFVQNYSSSCDVTFVINAGIVNVKFGDNTLLFSTAQSNGFTLNGTQLASAGVFKNTTNKYAHFANALTWAGTFNTQAGALCAPKDGSGVLAGWSSMACISTYSNLAKPVKDIIAHYAADENGDTIAQAMARYDYATSTYNTLSKFVKDSSETARSGSIIINRVGQSYTQSYNATIIIVVISLVSLTAVGGYFLLKKKKEQ